MRAAARAVGVLSSTAAALLLSACSKEPVESVVPVEPFDNVVLVTIDTLRADHLGCYGYPRPVSPFLDSLAERGVRFDAAVSSATITAPSHSSIFTSQYTARHWVVMNGMTLSDAIPTLAGQLGEAGFETQAIFSIRFLKGVANGFESKKHRRGKGQWKATNIVNQALAWAAERDTSRPFFLWVHFYDVHQSHRPELRPPEPFLSQMEADAAARGEELEKLLVEGQSRDLQVLVDGVEVINRYDGQIAYVDQELQRLFESLEADPDNGRILWVITADHGEGLGSHGVLGHGEHLYGEQTRVPLILYGGEEWESGLVRSQTVRHIDLFPTVVELLDVDIDTEALAIEGSSLVPILADGDGMVEAEPRLAYSQRRPLDKRMLKNGFINEIVIAADDGRYKYILHSVEPDELYDLSADPLELENLVGRGLPQERELSRWLAEKYRWMMDNPLPGAQDTTRIEPEYVKELQALGYLH